MYSNTLKAGFDFLQNRLSCSAKGFDPEQSLNERSILTLHFAPVNSCNGLINAQGKNLKVEKLYQATDN